MNSFFLFSLVGGLFILYLWLGKRAAKSITKSSDFFLMGRQLTFLPLCLTLLATQLGGGTLIGAAEKSYEEGWVILLYPLGTLIGFLFLGFGFGAKLRKMNISTIPEIFEIVYKSRSLRLAASGISIASFYFILVGQGMAAKKFFATIGLHEPKYFIIFWTVFVIYTVMGGFKAVVKTDIIQSIIILLGLTLALWSLDFNQLNIQKISSSHFASATIPWSSYLLMPLGFMLIEQDMAQRCFAVKNTKIIAPAAITAGILLFAGSAIAIFFGMIGRDIALSTGTGSSILVSTIQTFSHPLIVTFFMVAIAMAIASTADSLLCSTASLLSCDFLEHVKISDKRKLLFSRLITFIIGISSLFLTYYFDSIVRVLLLSYELAISALLIPIVMAVILQKPAKYAAIFSFSTGIICFAIFHKIYTPPYKEVLILLLSLSAYCIGACFEKQKKLQT
jgi:SSS family solute:Na+ symporter